MTLDNDQRQSSAIDPGAATLRLKAFTRVSNAGDQFNFAIIQRYLQRPIEVCGADAQEDPNLILLGSILQWADAQSTVCGAGFLAGDAGLAALPQTVLLLRGPLSAARMEQLGGPVAQGLPLADPGVLASRLYPATAEDIPFAVIPHYVDQQAPALRQVIADGGVVIDPLQPLDSYFDLLRRSRIVLSSTLHGLIFAHAYGKPTLWLEFSDRVLGRGFKFLDYYASLGVQPEAIPYARVTRHIRLAKLLGLARPQDNSPMISRVEQALEKLREIY